MLEYQPPYQYILDTSALFDFKNNYPEAIFLEPCDSEIEILQSVLEYYPSQIIEKYGTGAWADPLVIACAKHYKLPIITHETNDHKQYKIPPVAKHFGVKCLRLINLFEDQSWQF